jgi:hypothetical protein
MGEKNKLIYDDGDPPNPPDMAEIKDVLTNAKLVHCAGNLLLTDRDNMKGNGQYDAPYVASYWNQLVKVVQNGV